MGEEITLCPGCNCMTHTATLNKCGKCGATKPTAPADEDMSINCHRAKVEDWNNMVRKIADLQDALAESEKRRAGAEAKMIQMQTPLLELAEKDQRIEELEEQRSVSLNQINTLGAKFKSAEAVVEAGRELNMRMDVVHADEEYKSVWLLAHTHGGYQGPNYKDEKERFEAALSAHDNQQKQEPEEQHFIEEGLAERCKKV